MSWPQDKIREHRLDDVRRRERLLRVLRDAGVPDRRLLETIDEVIEAWHEPRPLS